MVRPVALRMALELHTASEQVEDLEASLHLSREAELLGDLVVDPKEDAPPCKPLEVAVQDCKGAAVAVALHACPNRPRTGSKRSEALGRVLDRSSQGQAKLLEQYRAVATALLLDDALE